MPLKSMRMPPEGTLLGGPVEVTKPSFFPGLSIHLDDEAMNVLNMAQSPKVGESMMMEARVIVTASHESMNDGSGMRKSVTLQITDMELMGASKKEPAAIIFTEDN